MREDFAIPRWTPTEMGGHAPGSRHLPPRLLQLLEASSPSAVLEEALASPSPPLRPAAPAQATAPGSEPHISPTSTHQAAQARPVPSNHRYPPALLTARALLPRYTVGGQSWLVTLPASQAQACPQEARSSEGTRAHTPVPGGWPRGHDPLTTSSWRMGVYRSASLRGLGGLRAHMWGSPRNPRGGPGERN